MRKALLYCLLLACAAQNAPAQQQQSVGFKVGKPDKVTLATPFQLDFNITLPQDACAIDIDTGTQPSDDFMVTDVQRPADKANPRDFAFTVMPFALDVATFPALSWLMQCPGQKQLLVKSPPMPFEIIPISTATAEGADIVEIKPQYSPFPWPPLWLWLLMALVLAALYWQHKRLRKTLAPAEKPDNRPAHVRALDELEALIQSQLWEDGRHMEFFVRLSGILRSYLERRFGLEADKLTSYELYRTLLYSQQTQNCAALARSFLNDCDLVKFAKQLPDSAQKDATVGKLRQLISATMPPPPPQAGAQGTPPPPPGAPRA